MSEKANTETNQIDFTDASMVTSVLCEAIKETVISTTEQTLPIAVYACVTVIKDLVKNELKSELVPEIIEETKHYVDQSVSKVNSVLTQKMVQIKSNTDKVEGFTRRVNLCFSGIEEAREERKDPSITADKIVNELANIDCEITKDDLSSCTRLYRQNDQNPNPNIIVARFVSQQIRDKVLSYQHSFNSRSDGKYMNEDMTSLQRNMFSYLRKKEDIVIKKTVSFKDGHIICLLKKNEGKTRGWSKIRNISDLLALDASFTDELSNNDFLKHMDLLDCKVNINLE